MAHAIRHGTCKGKACLNHSVLEDEQRGMWSQDQIRSILSSNLIAVIVGGVGLCNQSRGEVMMEICWLVCWLENSLRQRWGMTYLIP